MPRSFTEDGLSRGGVPASKEVRAKPSVQPRSAFLQDSARGNGRVDPAWAFASHRASPRAHLSVWGVTIGSSVMDARGGWPWSEGQLAQDMQVRSKQQD